MKSFLSVIISILLSTSALADCAASGLWTIPESGTIQQNSLIVIEGYAMSQKLVRSLNKDYPVYLQAEGHRVKLTVKGTHEGMYSITQAILSPDEALKPGLTYTLRIDNLEKDEQGILTPWNSEKGERAPIAWKVERSTDMKAPRMGTTAKLTNTNVTYFGCGPAVYADFKLDVEDDSQLLIRTELIDLASGEKHEYHLAGTSPIQVGHSMCSGAFDFEKGAKYKVRFLAMDICGNKASNWTDWVEFDSPYDKVE